MVIGVQLAAAIQQGRGAVLNALDHDRQTSLVAVHIAVIQAVHLMLHQGLVGLGAEVHHELLDHRAGLFHIAAGGLVLVAVAVPVVAVISVARISVGYQGSSQGAGVGGSGLGRIGTVAALAVAFTIAVSVVAVSVAIPIVVAVVPIVIAVHLVVDVGIGIVPVVRGIGIGGLTRIRSIGIGRIGIGRIGIGSFTGIRRIRVSGLAGVGDIGRGIGGGRGVLLAAGIVIPVAVLGDDPGVFHESAQAVVGVDALLGVAVDAPDHLVGLVVGVLAGSLQLLVLAVLLQDQVAPVVVGAGGVGLPVVGGAVHLLVEVVVDVVAVVAADARLVGQVAQAIVGIGAGGITVVVVGGDEAVQRVVGIEGLVLRLASAVAPHVLIGHVAVGVILISMLLGLGGLFAGMGVVHRQQAAHLVVGVILHPAVGIAHLRDAGHAVVGVGGLAAVGLRHLGLVVDQIVFIGGLGAVGIQDFRLVAHAVVGVLHPVALVVGGGGQLMQQIQLEGGGAQPVGHGYQVSGLVVSVRNFLGIIVIDCRDQIKGVVSVFRGVAVGIGFGDQVAVAVVGVGGDIAQGVHLLGDEAPAVELVQGDLPLVHVVLGIHPVELGGGQAAHLVVLKEGRGAQRVDGLHHIAHAVVDVLGGIPVGVGGAGDVAHPVIGHGCTLTVRCGGLDETVQRIVLIEGVAVHGGHFDAVAVAVILVGGDVTLGVRLGGHFTALGVLSFAIFYTKNL